MDCAEIARKAGLANLMITAGYANEKPLREMCKVTDDFAFGLKGFNEMGEALNDYFESMVNLSRELKATLGGGGSSGGCGGGGSGGGDAPQKAEAAAARLYQALARSELQPMPRETRDSVSELKRRIEREAVVLAEMRRLVTGLLFPTPVPPAPRTR